MPQEEDYRYLNKSTESNLSLLRDTVKRFQVCWEVWPEQMYVQHEKRQIGFALELAGTHEAGVEHPTPGCEHCRRVFAALQDIAMYILPQEERPSTHEIEHYRQALQYTPKRRNRPDVILTVKISHNVSLFLERR